MTVKWKNRMISDVFITKGYSNTLPLAGNLTPVSYCREAQLTSSEGHAFRKLGRSKDNIGGPFTSQKVEVFLGHECEPRWIRTVGSSGQFTREYYLLPVPHLDVKSALNLETGRRDESPARFRTWMNSVNPLGFSDNELTALGTKAIDSMAPLNPVADVSTTLAEFISERRFFNLPGHAGSVPGEYLNYSFGIAPTVGFAQDLRTAMEDQEKILAQVARDSGRRIRRDGIVFTEQNVNDLTPYPPVQEYPAYLGVGPSTQINARGDISITETVERQAWFSGSFTYYLPKEGLLRTVAELDALYGIQPGLDTAWELLPFSWLVDYVSSAGSAISNIARFAEDGLIMHYGYIMGKTVRTTDYSWEGLIRNRFGTLERYRLEAKVVKTTLQRKPASPFGFGILPGDLNPRQLSILAALGLSYLK